jgi:hypothetical protein
MYIHILNPIRIAQHRHRPPIGPKPDRCVRFAAPQPALMHARTISKQR